MASEDKLTYFDVRARAEPTRMLYALAGKSFKDERISFEAWPSKKEAQPLGQLPVFECDKGMLIMSNTIARYVAKKLNLAGSCPWEEALNDMVVETAIDCFEDVALKIYLWKVFKRVPEPEDPAKVMEEVKAKVTKGLCYIQSVAEKRGKKFIVSDRISLADVWLFSSLEFGSLAFPDLMELNPWVKQFVAKVKDDEKLKKYLADRSDSSFGL